MAVRAFSAWPVLSILVGLTAPEHAAVVARVRLVVQLVTQSSPAVYEVFDAAWNRATPWCEILASSMHSVAVALPSRPDGSVAALGFVRANAGQLLKATQPLGLDSSSP